jgi:tRNA1(Val) A37 N6-methylase TrmN6
MLAAIFWLMLNRIMMTDHPPRPASLAETDLTTDYIFDQAVQLRQPVSGYRFGTDAVFLAASVPAGKGRLLDMGAGAGAVSLGVSWRLPDYHITAVEKDPYLAALLASNIEANGRAERIRALEADITSLPPVLAGSFDQLVANPPFHQPGGTRPSDRRRALAHQGDGPSLADWVAAGLRALKPKGRLSFICRSDRADEVLAALYGKAGEIVQFPLWPARAAPAIRTIISARKGVAGGGALLAGMVLHNMDGSLTNEAQQVMKGQPIDLAHPGVPRPRAPASTRPD